MALMAATQRIAPVALARIRAESFMRRARARSIEQFRWVGVVDIVSFTANPFRVAGEAVTVYTSQEGRSTAPRWGSAPLLLPE